MENKTREYIFIVIINLLYAIISYSFLGGISSILIAYMDILALISTALWVVYIITQYMIIKKASWKKDKSIQEILRAILFSVCFIILKMCGDFIFTRVSIFNQMMRRTAILLEIESCFWGGTLIVTLFLVIGRAKVIWSWKRIRVPLLTSILPLLGYGAFVINRLRQYSIAVEMYGDTLEQIESIDLYFAYKITDGNAWFYAAFAIALWWFMRRLTGVEKEEVVKENKRILPFTFIDNYEAQETEGLVELLAASNDIEVGMLCNLLQENEIPSVVQDKESGAAMKLYLGGSIYEKRILVDKSQYSKAKKLIEEVYSSGGQEMEDMAEYEELSRARERQRTIFLAATGGIIVVFVLIVWLVR